MCSQFQTPINMDSSKFNAFSGSKRRLWGTIDVQFKKLSMIHFSEKHFRVSYSKIVNFHRTDLSISWLLCSGPFFSFHRYHFCTPPMYLQHTRTLSRHIDRNAVYINYKQVGTKNPPLRYTSFKLQIFWDANTTLSVSLAYCLRAVTYDFIISNAVPLIPMFSSFSRSKLRFTKSNAFDKSVKWPPTSFI